MGMDAFAVQHALETPDERPLTIGEVAQRYQVTLRALRFYEDRGLIAPTRIGATRLYDRATLRRLELVLKGKQLGFTLTDIRAMVSQRPNESSPRPGLALAPDQIVAQIELLRRQRDGIDHAIAELEAAQSLMVGDEAVSFTPDTLALDARLQPAAA